MERLSLLKLLADRSRYRIYQEVAGSSEALPTSEISRRLELHPNTVRVHLDKMREAGLLEATPDRHGAIGRPEYRWSAVPPPPALGLEPSGLRLLAHLLAELAASAGLAPEAAASVGRRWMAVQPAVAVAAGEQAVGGAEMDTVIHQLALLGFDPAVELRDSPGQADEAASIAFASCPFRELAAVYPDIICELHRGITEGITEQVSRQGPGRLFVRAFSSLVEEDPCRVEVYMAP